MRFAPQRSEEMQRAIHALRNGQTRGQREQAMLDRAIFAGIQGAATGAGALAERYNSDQMHEEQANREQMKRAIENQTAMRDRDLRTMAESKQYAAADYAGPSPDARGIPSWLKEGGEAERPTNLSLKTDEAKAQLNSNAAAAGASIGGYRTPSGLDAQDAESDTLAGDMNTGKNLMRAGSMMGGMMGSLPRRY